MTAAPGAARANGGRALLIASKELLAGLAAILAAVPPALASDRGEGREETFFVRMPEDVISVTHGGAVGLKPFPEGVPVLDDPALKTALALTVRVRNKNGEVIGFASELEDFPNGKDAAAKWNARWTVVVPGRGALFAFEEEAIPAAHAAAFKSVAEGKNWDGSIGAQVAAGPRADGKGVILGGDGEFSGAAGSIAEFTTLNGLTTDGVMTGLLELRVSFER